MKILDFLKKFTSKEPEPVETEKIKLENIENWLKEKKQQTEKENSSISDSIKETINKIIQELNQKIPELEKVDVDKIKSEEKMKFVVKENLLKYKEQTEKFKNDLENLEQENPVKLIEKINNLFSNFQKRSSMNFQKATILVGKELGNIKDCIGVFIADIKKITEKNKSSFDKVKILDSIEEKITEKDKIENSKLNIRENLKKHDSKIMGLENEIQKIKKNIENQKNTEEYKEKLKKKQEIKNLKEKLNSKIYNLKQVINFKELTQFFHINQNDLEIVKAHKENFKKEFEKDNGEKILNLFNESKLINPALESKFGEISEIKKQINNFIVEEDEVEKLSGEIGTKKTEIESLITEKNKEEKTYKKFCEYLENINSFIKKDLNAIDADIE